MIAVVVASGCAVRSGLGQGTAEMRVTWAELRAEADRHTCAVWYPEVQQWGMEIFSETCGAVRERGLGEWVHEAIQASEAIVPLASAAYDQFDTEAASPGLDRASATDLARRAVWRDPLLSRAIQLQLGRALEQRRVRCKDCRIPAGPEPVMVEWERFEPYLLAYLWPVQATPGGPVEVYTCSGTNGAADLPASEPLKQAGFLVAARFAEDAETEAEIVRLGSRHNAEASRSAAGMAREIEAFVRSPAGRARTCRAVSEVAWFTGVAVRECDPPGA